MSPAAAAGSSLCLCVSLLLCCLLPIICLALMSMPGCPEDCVSEDAYCHDAQSREELCREIERYSFGAFYQAHFFNFMSSGGYGSISAFTEINRKAGRHIEYLFMFSALLGKLWMVLWFLGTVFYLAPKARGSEESAAFTQAPPSAVGKSYPQNDVA